MAKRKETNAALDEFAKDYLEICSKHGLLSAVCITATTMQAATGSTTIGMGMVFAGSALMHESLCAYGFGYSSGRHVETMDSMKSYGRKHYEATDGE